MEKPYESWIFNEELQAWLAPVNMPEDEWFYVWDEVSVSWKNTGCRVDPFMPGQVFTP